MNRPTDVRSSSRPAVKNSLIQKRVASPKQSTNKFDAKLSLEPEHAFRSNPSIVETEKPEKKLFEGGSLNKRGQQRAKSQSKKPGDNFMKYNSENRPKPLVISDDNSSIEKKSTNDTTPNGKQSNRGGNRFHVAQVTSISLDPETPIEKRGSSQESKKGKKTPLSERDSSQNAKKPATANVSKKLAKDDSQKAMNTSESQNNMRKKPFLAYSQTPKSQTTRSQSKPSRTQNIPTSQQENKEEDLFDTQKKVPALIEVGSNSDLDNNATLKNNYASVGNPVKPKQADMKRNKSQTEFHMDKNSAHKFQSTASTTTNKDSKLGGSHSGGNIGPFGKLKSPKFSSQTQESLKSILKSSVSKDYMSKKPLKSGVLGVSSPSIKQSSSNLGLYDFTNATSNYEESQVESNIEDQDHKAEHKRQASTNGEVQKNGLYKAVHTKILKDSSSRKNIKKLPDEMAAVSKEKKKPPPQISPFTFNQEDDYDDAAADDAELYSPNSATKISKFNTEPDDVLIPKQKSVSAKDPTPGRRNIKSPKSMRLINEITQEAQKAAAAHNQLQLKSPTGSKPVPIRSQGPISQTERPNSNVKRLHSPGKQFDTPQGQKSTGKASTNSDGPKQRGLRNIDTTTKTNEFSTANTTTTTHKAKPMTRGLTPTSKTPKATRSSLLNPKSQRPLITRKQDEVENPNGGDKPSVKPSKNSDFYFKMNFFQPIEDSKLDEFINGVNEGQPINKNNTARREPSKTPKGTTTAVSNGGGSGSQNGLFSDRKHAGNTTPSTATTINSDSGGLKRIQKTNNRASQERLHAGGSDKKPVTTTVFTAEQPNSGQKGSSKTSTRVSSISYTKNSGKNENLTFGMVKTEGSQPIATYSKLDKLLQQLKTNANSEPKEEEDVQNQSVSSHEGGSEEGGLFDQSSENGSEQSAENIRQVNNRSFAKNLISSGGYGIEG